MKVLHNDPNSAAFGLDSISQTPQTVRATILPQAKLQYGGNHVIDPKFAGTWSADYPQTQTVIRPPLGAVNGGYMYGVLIVGSNGPRDVTEFCAKLQSDSTAAQLYLFIVVYSTYATLSTPPNTEL